MPDSDTPTPFTPSPQNPDKRVARTIPMDSPEYSAQLTDPQAEVDDAFKTIKRIAERYGLAYFLLVNHPISDGSVKHQLMCDVVAPATAEHFYEGLSIEVRSVSKGRFDVVEVGGKGGSNSKSRNRRLFS